MDCNERTLAQMADSVRPASVCLGANAFYPSTLGETMSNHENPREFYVQPDSHHPMWKNGQEHQLLSCSEKPMWKNEIHVIEKSYAEKLESELRNIDRAVLIAERRLHGDNSDKMDASQETAHYNWLDDENERLESELSGLREANNNCISLLLHESRMKAVEDERDELKAENAKYRQEMDKITNGIPSEWAYAILRKERDELKAKLEAAEKEIASLNAGYGSTPPCDCGEKRVLIREPLDSFLGVVVDVEYSRCPKCNITWTTGKQVQLAERAIQEALAKQRDSLKSEVERWKSEASNHARVADQCAAEKLTLQGEVERLTSNNEFLKSTLDRNTTLWENRITKANELVNRYRTALENVDNWFSKVGWQGKENIPTVVRTALADAPQVDNNIDNDVYNGPSKDALIERLVKSLRFVDWDLLNEKGETVYIGEQDIRDIKLALEAAKGAV